MGSDFFIRDYLVLDGGMDGFELEGAWVAALEFDEALSDGKLAKCVLLVFFEQEVVGSSVDVLAGFEVEGEGEVGIS